MHTHTLTHVCTQVASTPTVCNTSLLGSSTLSNDDLFLLQDTAELQWAPGVNKRTKRKKSQKKKKQPNKKTKARAHTQTHMHTCIFLVVSDGTSYVISYGSLMSFLKSQWSRRLMSKAMGAKRWEQRKLRRPERTQTHTHIHFLWHDGIYEMSFLWIVLWSYGYLMSSMESH